MEWQERPLFGDERLKTEVWFSQATGWRWQVMIWDPLPGWAEVDSGTTTSYKNALEDSAQVALDIAAGLEGF